MMKKKEFKKIFREAYLKDIPISFQLIREVYVSKEEAKSFGVKHIGKSDLHNTIHYELFKYYKPVSQFIITQK